MSRRLRCTISLTLFLVFTLTVSRCLYAQNRQLDSMKTSLGSNPPDSVRVRTLHRIVQAYYRTGDFRTALQYELQAKETAERLDNKKILGTIYNGLGLLYVYQNNFSAALQYHFKALALQTQLHDSSGIIASLCNIGIVYNNTKNIPKAMEYYLKALDLENKIGKRDMLDKIYNNLGSAYAEEKEYEKARACYFKALQQKEANGDSAGMATSMVLIADNYDAMNQPEMAILWYKKSCRINENLGDLFKMAIDYNNLGLSYLNQKKYREAEEFLLKAEGISEKNDYLLITKDCAKNLSKLYEQKRDGRKALHYYKRHIAARDSVFNEENTKKMVQEEMNFEFEKKQALLRAEQDKKDAVAAADKRRQRMILWSISGLGSLVLGFALFAWRSFLQKKKANQAILQQKHVIEEKQKEILDSIHYARRIQHSLLANDQYIEKNLKRLKNA